MTRGIATSHDIFLYPGFRVGRLIENYGIRFDSENDVGLVNLFISENTISTGSAATSERIEIIDRIVEELLDLRKAILIAEVS